MRKSIIARSVLAGTLGIVTSPLAFAGELREEILVTATRTPVSVAETLSSATAIPRDEIEALQPTDLVDVLRVAPGLDISRSGGPGSAASLYTRGTGSGHTLFLVDGQRVGSATLGSTSFQFLNPEQIERIEVVRGSHSALYGSDAIGGVVQVFTRDGSGAGADYVRTSAGSNDLYELAAGTNGRAGNWHYGVNLSYLDTEGIDHLTADDGFNGDDDGYRNESANASLGYRFANGATLQLRWLESDNRNEYDNAFDPMARPYTDTRIRNANLRGRLPVTDSWSSTLSLGVAREDSNNYDGATGLGTGAFRTEREQLFWQNDVTLADEHLVTVAYDYYEDRVESTSSYTDAAGNPVDSRDNQAVLAEYQGDLGRFDVVLGARQDDNEEYGEHTTGNAAVGVAIDADHRIVASWSEGFKAPTFNDLYWPAGPFTAGNPDLAPEESENYEIGVRGEYDRWRWELTGFRNDVANLINWTPGDDFVLRPYNVNDAEITGAELVAAAEVAGWSIDASYTYVEARDDSTDHLIENRARSNLVINAVRPVGDWDLGVTLKAQDGRYTDAANTDALGGYATVDARAAYAITDGLEASVKLENALDKDYQLNEGYNQQGRTWRLNLRYTL